VSNRLRGGGEEEGKEKPRRGICPVASKEAEKGGERVMYRERGEGSESQKNSSFHQ